MYSRQSHREKCELCHKSIYSHDILLVCNNDNKPYHAKCLKIDRDTAFELQTTPDWFCPKCIEENLPICDYFSDETPKKLLLLQNNY